MNINVPELNLPRIVVIGGGFGGLELVKKLKNKEVQVVLIDQNNYHTFQPLLYQVASAGLEPDSIVFPLRKIFKNQANFHFRMAKAERVAAEENTLYTSIGSIRYDYLVIATGSDSNYFGMKQVEKHSLPMKSIVEALDLRSVILQSFEQALLTADLEKRESLMNFVIVGGGPTGVELAGALGELKTHVLPNDYPELDIRRMQIHLIEAADRLLNGMSEVSSKKAKDFLKKFDVNIWLNTQVKDYDGYEVFNNSGKELKAQTLIWSAGVRGNSLNGIDAHVVNRQQRILVNEFNQIQGYSNIFAIGDVAAMLTDAYPKGHPMVAPVAIQQGSNLAKNLLQLLKNAPLKAFTYKDKGSMATVGRNRAVVEVGKFKTQGFMAWFMWMAVHLMSLVGFRNKLVTLINWMWSYFKYDKGIRLIIRPHKRFETQKETAKPVEELVT